MPASLLNLAADWGLEIRSEQCVRFDSIKKVVMNSSLVLAADSKVYSRLRDAGISTQKMRDISKYPLPEELTLNDPINLPPDEVAFNLANILKASRFAIENFVGRPPRAVTAFIPRHDGHLSMWVQQLLQSSAGKKTTIIYADFARPSLDRLAIDSMTSAWITQPGELADNKLRDLFESDFEYVTVRPSIEFHRPSAVLLSVDFGFCIEASLNADRQVFIICPPLETALGVNKDSSLATVHASQILFMEGD